LESTWSPFLDAGQDEREFGKPYSEWAALSLAAQKNSPLNSLELSPVTETRQTRQTGLNPLIPKATRVRAADSVINHATKAIEIEDIDVRVAALEQAAEQSKQGR
jgi:hypothetical protein